MTDSALDAPTVVPRPKQPAPGLFARAPRPPAIRIRRSVVIAAVMGAAGLLAAAVAWAFILQPYLQAHAVKANAALPHDGRNDVIRPTELVTKGPSSYAQSPGALPPARSLLGAAKTSPTTTPQNAPTVRASAAAVPRPIASTSTASSGPSVSVQARTSGLFFVAPNAGGAASPSGGDSASALLARASTPVVASASGAARADYAMTYNGHPLQAPLSPFELKAGAIIPAALLTGVDTTREGPVVASVTENVFDTVSGRYLLLPQGTRLIGRHGGDNVYGDRRAFLVWTRLILPNGKSLVLTEEPGVDAQGTVGVRGQVDRRIGSLVMATLFGGAVTAIGEVARDHTGRGSGGLIGDAGDAAAIQGAQVAGRLIDRELQVKPTVRLQPGAPVRVLVTRDLILEPYQP